MAFNVSLVNARWRVDHNGHHGHRHLSKKLAQWLADLAAADELKREQLRKIAELRRGIYRDAKSHAVSAETLRALHPLVRNGGRHV